MFRSAFLLILSVVLLGASLYFFYGSAKLLVDKDYISGLLHIVSGLALVRAGIEFARLSVLSRPGVLPPV